MKKLAIWFVTLTLLGLCAATPVLATNYAVCVGINTYTLSGCKDLNGCIPDATHVKDLVTSRGNWDASNVTMLTNSAAKLVKIRQTVSNYAARAVSGDKFLYYQSSHGGNDNYYFTTNSGKVYLHYGLDTNGVGNCICAYDAEYTAKKMATDLAAFPSGVEIVVMLDTCHSAGMFKYAATTSAKKALAAKLAEAKAGILTDGSSDNGETAEEPVPENSVAGFFMAAVLDQLEKVEAEQVRRGLRPRSAKSLASNVGWIAAADYDQYSWDSQVSDGGEFTIAFIDGVTNQNMMCDNATYGNQDGYASFYEGWNYAKDIARGQRNYSAWEYDDDYGYYDYIWTDAQCTNTAVLSSVLVGWAGTTAPVIGPETPEVPSTPPVADTSSFTATWSAVADASYYKLYVQRKVAASTSARAARDAGTVLEADFSDTTGWTLSGTSSYSDSKYCGKAAPSIKFDSTGDYAISPEFSGGSKLSFWAYGNGGSGSTFAISGLVNSVWTYIDTVSIADGGDTYEVNLPSGTTQLRFDFTKVKNCALDDVTVTGSADTWEDLPGSPFTVSGTSKALTGLSSGTEYRYAVSAVDSDGVEGTRSSYVTVTTADGDSAPAWDAIPAQTVTVGGTCTLDISTYVTGSPTPTITMTGSGATFDGSEFSFTPAATGEFSFTFTADNGIGDAQTATLTVTVSAAPVTVPVLTVSDVGASSAVASWTACDGVSSYQLQVATDNQFTSGSSAGGTFTLVTSVDQLTAGDYVILGETADTAMNNTCSGDSDGYFSCTDVTVTDSTVTPEDSSIIWTITGDASSCTIFNSAVSKYVNPSTTKAKAGWSDTASGSWTLSMNNGIVSVANAANTSWKLQYNNTTPRFTTYSSSMKNLRFFRRDAGRSAKDGGSVILDTTTSDLSYEVTGLTPDTTYYARVKGNAEWSNVAEFTTGHGTASAPVWSTLPAQAVTVGETCTLDLSGYVTGSPAPSISMAETVAGASLTGTMFSFTPTAADSYTFTFTATNSEGDDGATLTVTVSAAPVTVPTLEVGDATDTTAYALWSECTGVTTYTLQLASDNQFTTSGSGAAVLEADFSDTTGWTLSGTSTYTGSTYCGDSVPSIAFKNTGNYAISPEFSGGTNLSFWAYGNGTGSASTFTISRLVDGDWTEIETVSIAIGAGTYEVNLPSGTTQLRFDFTKNGYNCALDDVVVTGFSGSGSLIAEYTVSDTEYTFTGLTPETTYYARVKGTSDWSNVETFTTLAAATGTAPSIGAIADQTYTYGDNEGWFTLTVTATGDPAPGFSVASSDAPEGSFTIGENDGEFLFEPAAVGTFHFTVTATNAVSPDATATFAVTVTGTAPTLAAIADQTVAVEEEDLAIPLTVTGNPAPTVSVASSDAPEGMFEINSDGDFYFVFDEAGTFHFTITAANGVSPDATVSFTVTVTGGETPLTDYQQWLQDHNIATDTSADAAAPNGHTYGENYAADIDPSSTQWLEITVSSTNFTFAPSSTNRYYQLLYTTDLSTGIYQTNNLGKGASSGSFPDVEGDWYGGLRVTP